MTFINYCTLLKFTHSAKSVYKCFHTTANIFTNHEPINIAWASANTVVRKGGISTGNQQILFNRGYSRKGPLFEVNKTNLLTKNLVIIGPRTNLMQCFQVSFVDNSANISFLRCFSTVVSINTEMYGQKDVLRCYVGAGCALL